MSLEQYYQDVLLMQQLLPAIPSITGHMFVFHQDNAPANCTRDKVKLLHYETSQFINSDMSPANPDDTRRLSLRNLATGPLLSVMGCCWVVQQDPNLNSNLL